MGVETAILAGPVLEDGRLYLWFGIAALVVLAVIALIALAVRGALRKTRR